jgi:hypothetical protein
LSRTCEDCECATPEPGWLLCASCRAARGAREVAEPVVATFAGRLADEIEARAKAVDLLACNANSGPDAARLIERAMTLREIAAIVRKVATA